MNEHELTMNTYIYKLPFTITIVNMELCIVMCKDLIFTVKILYYKYE